MGWNRCDMGKQNREEEKQRLFLMLINFQPIQLPRYAIISKSPIPHHGPALSSIIFIRFTPDA